MTALPTIEGPPLGRSGEPFRVVCELAAPLVGYGDPIHLDGLLGAAVARSLGSGRLPDPNLTPDPLDLDVPLCAWRAPCGAWGWQASREFAQQGHEDTVPVRKKARVGEMAAWSGDKTVNTSQGWAKPWDLALPARHVRTLTWYAVGDREEALWWLKTFVGFVGKKHNLGGGEVKSWTAEPWGDPDAWRWRVLPASMAPPGAVLYPDGVRAPYWHPSRQVEAWRPHLKPSLSGA